MGITIFKMFIWGGISSNICLKSRFTAPLAHRSDSTCISSLETFVYCYRLNERSFLPVERLHTCRCTTVTPAKGDILTSNVPVLVLCAFPTPNDKHDSISIDQEKDNIVFACL